MEDRWRNKFKDKMSDYQPDIVIPPYAGHRAFSKFPILLWLAGAAAVTVVLFLSIYKQDTPTKFVIEHSIEEEVAAIPRALNHITPESLLLKLNSRPSIPDNDDVLNSISMEEVIEDIEEGQNQVDLQDVHLHQHETLPEDDSITEKTERIIFSVKQPNRRSSLKINGTPFLGIFEKEIRELRGVAGIETTKMDTLFSYMPPIKAGLSLSYYLSDHWTIESGLNYSFQLSNWKIKDSGVISGSKTYQAHYLGIPFKVGYHYFESHRWEFYAASGGEFAIRLSVNEKSEYYGHFSERTLTSHPFRIALSAVAGINYQLTPNLSLYAEPGIGWYMQRNKDIPSSSHPVFEMNVGLRFHL